jgi:hypothetical protein
MSVLTGLDHFSDMITKSASSEGSIRDKDKKQKKEKKRKSTKTDPITGPDEMLKNPKIGSRKGSLTQFPHYIDASIEDPKVKEEEKPVEIDPRAYTQESDHEWRITFYDADKVVVTLTDDPDPEKHWFD